jgi:hypothetical protein
VFAIDVAVVSTLRSRRVTSLAPWISAVDFAWVLASIATIALGWFSTTGAVVIAVVAVTVAAFGVEQLVLSRQGARSATR